jgi:hypothetical protein
VGQRARQGALASPRAPGDADDVGAAGVPIEFLTELFRRRTSSFD